MPWTVVFQVRNHVAVTSSELRSGADWPGVNSICFHHQIRVLPIARIPDGAVLIGSGRDSILQRDAPVSATLCIRVGCEQERKQLLHTGKPRVGIGMYCILA